MPAIFYMPGFMAEPAWYAASARYWASYGYVVVMPYDLWNSTVELPLMGAQTLAGANNDPNSPLHGKVDLGRVVMAGHSGGGGAVAMGAVLPPDVYRQIDPAFRIIGAVPTESSPVAAGFVFDVPTLYLTGCADAIVWHWYLIRWLGYQTALRAPAYLACVRGANHNTPMDGPAYNAFAPLTLGWAQYLAKGDQEAARYFVGPQWSLPGDPRVEYAFRNTLADALPPPA
ncbi:hypothetical protein ACIBCN_06305 [Nocardia sp. NPDC051052]|uniref:hypothetical protein n=1 Tax=Nocardia sp. NPDC051052 TaxID=3364322 RepID=UPI0037A1B2C1